MICCMNFLAFWDLPGYIFIIINVTTSNRISYNYLFASLPARV